LLTYAIAFSCVFAGLGIELPNSQPNSWLNTNEAAYAKSTGGRSKGGSFKKSPSSSSPRRSSSPSNSNSSTTTSTTTIYHSSGGGNTVIMPMWAQLMLFICFALLAVILLFTLVLNVLKAIQGSFGKVITAEQELDNDTVTVSKIQVALLAQARSLQSQLSELSLSANTDTSEGLLQLMQESVLVLLRNAENWTHVSTSSQSVHRDRAEVVFNEISLQQRSNLSVETLTNVNGLKQQKPVTSNLEEGSADYIVVTLIIGTADDRPIFTEVRTIEALTTTLTKIGSMRSDYLMMFELIWSPQVETDTLTYDELLTEYTNMAQIA
jgi:uncharacterized membrane protein